MSCIGGTRTRPAINTDTQRTPGNLGFTEFFHLIVGQARADVHQ